MTRRSLYIAAAIGHLLLVVAAASADLLAALAKGETLLPDDASALFGKAEKFIRPVLGQGLTKSSSWGECVALYLHSAGCEAGYNFFAPHVPGSHVLIFELRYNDGHIDYELPRGEAIGSKVRLASLLDLIGHIENETVRQQLIRLIAEESCRSHPDVATVHAIFGMVSSPTISHYENGAPESYRVLCSYDFKPGPTPPIQPAHD